MSKQHTKEFKLDALSYRKEHPELSVSAVCRNLNISVPTYYKWAKEFNQTNDIEVRGSGNHLSDEAKEIARLKKELQAKDDALRILKKAIGILGDEPK